MQFFFFPPRSSTASFLLTSEFLTGKKKFILFPKDIVCARDYLRDAESVPYARVKRTQQVIASLREQRIPEVWREECFQVPENDLWTFQRMLISKNRYLDQLVRERGNKLFPSTSLPKIYDPYSLILIQVLQYSRENNVIRKRPSFYLCFSILRLFMFSFVFFFMLTHYCSYFLGSTRRTKDKARKTQVAGYGRIECPQGILSQR